MEFGGGFGKARRISNCDEIPQVAKLHEADSGGHHSE